MASRLLIDTHALLWTTEGRRFPSYRLTTTAIQALTDADEVFVSSVSLWEIGIKTALQGSRGLRLSLPFDEWTDRLLASGGFSTLDVRIDHIKRIATLPPHHGDPFDRMLVAQALFEGIPILSADEALDPYGIERIW